MTATPPEARKAPVNLLDNATDESVLPPTSLARTLLMDRLIDLLVSKANAGVHWPDLYEHAKTVTRTLGLTTRGALLANHRLRNAERYAAAHHYGAAMFELRLVRTQLA